MTPGLSVNKAIEEWTIRFRKAGLETAKLDARLLALHACQRAREDLIGDPELAFSPEARALFLALAARRLECEPIAYILGGREFWSMGFYVDPSTLVPRPDSEALIEAALSRIENKSADLKVLDLGTGSGCLLLALLSELPQARGVGVDTSSGALKVARRNARRHGLEGRANFVRGNWAQGIDGRFDIIITNPPYIRVPDRASLARDVVDYEPTSALFGGHDGLDPLRAMLPDIKDLLTRNGLYIMECGADQAALAGGEMADFGLEVVEFHKDLSGIERCIVAKSTES